MPQCCNGCFYVDLVPDCIDKTSCWNVICCRSCCTYNPSDAVDRCCGNCTLDCCPCCPHCLECRYNWCVCACCCDNIIWDPMAFCFGPYNGDFNLLKQRIEQRKKAGAPQADEMLRA